MEDRHASDWGAGVVHGGRVDDVVGPDHPGDIGVFKVAVDLVHFEHDVVGNACLGEQNVHVSGQAAGDRMDCKFNIRTLFFQLTHHLGKGMLGLSDGEAVTGDDYYFACLSEQIGRTGGFYRMNITLRQSGRTR